MSYKKKPLSPRWFARFRDNPEVEVIDNNINGAIKELKKRIGTGGYFRIIRDRNRNPSKSARRRLKEQRAYLRTVRTLNRQ